MSDAILFINNEDLSEGEGSEGLEEEASDEPEEEASDEPEEEENATITSFDDLLSAENYVRVNEFVTSKVYSLSLFLSLSPFEYFAWFQIKDTVKFAQDINNTSFYKKVKKVIANHSKIDDENEAIDLGWDEKRFALKHFLINNREVLEPLLFEEEEDEEEEEDNDDSDN